MCPGFIIPVEARVLDAPDQEEESPDMTLAKEIAASESRFISKVVL